MTKGKYFVMTVCVTLFLSLVYVRTRFMVIELSYRVSKAKKESEKLHQLRDELSVELAVLKSPKRVQNLAQEKLGLDATTSPIKFNMKSSGGLHDF